MILRRLWMGFGFVLYLIIAFLLPVTVRLLGIYSDEPATYPRLVIPLMMLPFLMGFAARLFFTPWRLQLWCPAIIMLCIAVFSLIDGFSKREFLAGDLIFWPLLLGSYLAFSYVGKLTRDRIAQPARLKLIESTTKTELEPEP